MSRSRKIAPLAGALFAGWVAPAFAQYNVQPPCQTPVYPPSAYPSTVVPVQPTPAAPSTPTTPSQPSPPSQSAPDSTPQTPTQPSQAPGGMDGLFGNASDAASVGGFDAGEGPSALSSAVGYIDNAVVATQLRLRLDFAWNSNRPTRAEVFYPRGGGTTTPGLPAPETAVDYQQLFVYYEHAFSKDFSAFIDVPVRWINPDQNSNSYGFSDLMGGVRYSFVNTPCQIVTGQVRVYAPTGDGSRGLGTEHASIEPGVLTQRTMGNVNLYTETHFWQSLGGTNFAGNYIRYGLGASYGKPSACSFWVTPVAEVVGWTVLDGQQAIYHPPVRAVADATGDTIVNGKFGARFGWTDRWDLYAGYGRALTGEVWYKDVLRLELRSRF